MREAVELLAEVLDYLDDSVASQTSISVTVIRKKLNKVMELIDKDNEKAVVRGIDGQKEGLDNEEEGWEYEGPEE